MCEGEHWREDSEDNKNDNGDGQQKLRASQYKKGGTVRVYPIKTKGDVE